MIIIEKLNFKTLMASLLCTSGLLGSSTILLPKAIGQSPNSFTFIAGANSNPTGSKKRLRPSFSPIRDNVPPANKANISFKEKILIASSKLNHIFSILDYSECDFSLKDTSVFVNLSGDDVNNCVIRRVVHL